MGRSSFDAFSDESDDDLPMRDCAQAALRRRRRSSGGGPWPLMWLLCVLLALPLAQAVHIDLVRAGSLARRSSPAALADWAVIERARVMNKYDVPAVAAAPPSSPVLRPRQEVQSGGVSSGPTLPASVSQALASESAALSAKVASATASAHRTAGQAVLTNYQSDLEYYAPLLIGTPAQSYNVILDTGSADLWMASSNCSTAQCGAVPRLNPANSSSSVSVGQAFSIRYGVGTAGGWLYRDNMTLAGRNASNQTYAACDQVTTTLLSGNVSGLMGLGFQPLAASGLVPMWQNLLNAELAQSPSSISFPGFAFALTRFVNVSGASLNEFGGIFSLGALSNASFTGNISFVDIPTNLQSYWLIPMDAVVFNGTELPNVGTPNVAIDTGTTLVGGPQNVISDLYGRIPGSQAASGQYAGYYIFPCNASVAVGFTFGGITYNLTSADFNLGTFVSATATSPAMCLGSFFDLTLSAGSASVISWVLGDAFLKNVYTAFRYLPTPAVGFASLSPSFQSISPDGPLALNPSRSAASLSFQAPSVTASAVTSTGNVIPTTINEARNAVNSVSSAASQPSSRNSLIFTIGRTLGGLWLATLL